MLTVAEPIWNQFISDIILLHLIYILRMKRLQINPMLQDHYEFYTEQENIITQTL